MIMSNRIWVNKYRTEKLKNLGRIEYNALEQLVLLYMYASHCRPSATTHGTG